MSHYAAKMKDGGVMIVVTARDDMDPTDIINKQPWEKAKLAEPISFRPVTEADFPQDGEEYRDAWEYDGEKITVNVGTAKAIFDNRLRLHKLAMARELRDREDIGEDVTAERAALQAMKPDSTKAKTVTDLKALWPSELRR